MRVKITFTVDSEEVPEYAVDLGNKAKLELREAINSLSMALDMVEESGKNFGSILEVFDKVRQKLGQADGIIGDIDSILRGLHNFYNGDNNVSEGRSTMDTSGDTTVPATDTREG